nr:MAG TPA: restriction alleviation protein [Caudoviricetes sp.]
MMFRRKRCAYCGRIPVMEHRKAARTECARNSAQLFRVRCSCGNQTEWGLATSGY